MMAGKARFRVVPLAAFIFSRNQDAIDRFVGELSFGGGAVNQVNIHLFVETMPFGGVGSAGMGHYWAQYQHAKIFLEHVKLFLSDGVSPVPTPVDDRSKL
jgi:aldehyde dehydrogenase (NAD+)